MAEQYIKTNSLGTFYYKDLENRILHRVDGPAAEYANGSKSWYLNGKPHRLDGPTFKNAYGQGVWCVNEVIIFTVNKDGKILNKMSR